VEALGAYTKQHGLPAAQHAFARYQVPMQYAQQTPQQRETMLQVFRAMQLVQ
jgi:hypothetical protein